MIAAWLGVVGAASWLRLAATPRPGPAGAVPARLGPRAAERLGWCGERPLCVLAAAPQCALLPATLDALARALPDDRPTDVRVVVCGSTSPSDTPDAAALAALCDRLPPGIARIDPDGDLVRALGATTSGQVGVWDRDGTLAFAGGLVDGRGKPDADAVRALRRALGVPSTPAPALPVYGRPLAHREGAP